MPSFFSDNEDLQFYFDKGIDWGPLVRITEHDFRAPDGHKNTEEAVSFYRQVAELLGELAANEIAPHAAELDRTGVYFQDGEVAFPPPLARIFDRLKELEVHGMCLPRELGGMNCPVLLYFLTSELLARGDVSAMSHHSFHGGIAMAMLAFSIHEGTTEVDPKDFRILKTRWRDAIGEIARGEAWGSMDITEPHAGSDMAALRTVGELDEHGQWFVTGQKIFITSGHGKYQFVIARTEKQEVGDDAFAGLNGLSMFLVPAYEDRDGRRHRFVAIDRVEEKMGHHNSVTATLSFDRSPAQLVGNRGEGFRYMLTLMNNARVGVGFESLGLCEAAYRKAKAWADERWSMGKPIARHEIIHDYLDEMRTDIQGLRALAMHSAFHEELAQKSAIAAKLPGSDVTIAERAEKSHRKHAAKTRRATPLLKYLAAEKAVEMARRCIQIHGGSGYIREYGAEKLLRDALAMPIYEGTSQIQSLMAMKDTLAGIMKNPKRFFLKQAQARWAAVSARDPMERRLAKLQTLSLSAQNHLLTRTAGDKLKTLPEKPVSEWLKTLSRNWDPKRDFALAMLHAERLTRLLADELICELLATQARKFPERRELFDRYIDRAEPRCRFLHDEITTTGDRLLAGLEQEGAPGEATG